MNLSWEIQTSFSRIPFQDGGEEKPIEMCALEVDPLQSASGNVEVIIIADMRHIQRRSERKIVPMLCDVFLCDCPATPRHPRPCVSLVSHENLQETYEFADVLGTIAEDRHLTRCDQVCLTGTEDDQAEQHDHGTIDEVLGDPDMERGGDAPEEADREADPPEQIPLLGHSESRPYTSSHEVGIDLFEIIDSVGMRSSTSDGVCVGGAYVQVWVERKSDCSSPSFHTRLQAFVCDRSRPAGWPTVQTSSRTVS